MGSRYLELVRIPNGVGWAGGPLVVSLIFYQDLTALLAITVSMLFVGYFADVWNDVWDVDEDRVNAPDKPIPSGKVSRREALALAMIFFASALGFAALTFKTTVMIIVALGLFCALAYSMPPLRVKRIPVFGSAFPGIVIPVFHFLAGVYSQIDVRFSRMFFPLVLLLYYGASVASMKDLKDVEGDRRVGHTTLPMVIGEKGTILSVVVLSWIAIAILGYQLYVNERLVPWLYALSIAILLLREYGWRIYYARYPTFRLIIWVHLLTFLANTAMMIR